jgi:hypothetical protein
MLPAYQDPMMLTQNFKIHLARLKKIRLAKSAVSNRLTPVRQNYAKNNLLAESKFF